MEILKTEGIAGLYAGLESSIAGIAVTNTVFYLFRKLHQVRQVCLTRRLG